MANAVKKVNGIAIADIKNINGITDSNLKKLNTLEFAGVTDAHVLIDTFTADGSSTRIDITSGIDSTYDVYEFIYTNIRIQSDGERLQFQFNAATGSNTAGFDQNMTTTAFIAYHGESGSGGAVTYYGDFGADQAGTDAVEQPLGAGIGADDDQSISGVLTLYAPSSDTYVKHFMARSSYPQNGDEARDHWVAGYINTDEEIDEITFKTNTGNIEEGVIKMYGIAKS